MQPDLTTLNPLDVIYLTQTDTTVGFLSASATTLARTKQRPDDKPFLMVCPSFKALKTMVRVPKRFANIIRRSHKTSFIYPNNQAIRVVKKGIHHRFLQQLMTTKQHVFSTSANLSGKSFDENFAYQKADVIVYQGRHLQENTPSKLYKIAKKRLIRLR